MGGGKERKQADASAQAAANLANTEAALASQVGGISLPAFQKAIETWTAILGGDTGKTTPFVAPAAEAANASYSQAAKNILASTQRGGEQEAMLAGNEIAKAGQISSILPQLMATALQTLTGAGQSGTGMSMQGTQGAAGIFGNNAQTYASEANAKSNMLGQMAMGAGQAAGSYAGARAGGCWISEAIFGVDDVRTHLLRFWINFVWAQRLAGSVFRFVYIATGKRVAKAVLSSRVVRCLMTALFGKLLECARRECSWELLD